MIDLFSDDVRRNPFPVYDRMRSSTPVLHVPPPFDAWMIFDYEGVKRVLDDHDAFSSRVPAPRHWFIFFDPPSHTKLRALIMRAFTPRVVTNLEPRIRELSRGLLGQTIERGEMDLAADYSVPLPGILSAPRRRWPGDDGEPDQQRDPVPGREPAGYLAEPRSRGLRIRRFGEPQAVRSTTLHAELLDGCCLHFSRFPSPS
jgi:hypothetical protein